MLPNTNSCIDENNHDLQLSTLYKWMQFGLNYQYRRNAIAFMTKEYEGNPEVGVYFTQPIDDIFSV